MTGPVRLVAGREVKARLAAKSFRVSTAILLAASLAGVLVPHFLGHGRTVYDVGLVGPAPAGLADRLADAGVLLKATLRVRQLPDAAAAEAELKARTLDLALVDAERILARRDPPSALTLVLTQAVARAQAADRLARAGIAPEEAAAIVQPAPLPVEELDPESTAGKANRSLSFAGILLIYLALLTYGSLVSAGVVEEKTSRISEVLLGAVRPSQLMAGKVLGIGTAAVLQLLAVGVPTGVAALAVGSLHVPRGTPLTFLAIPMWFVLGYSLFSCAFAAAGASASRPEEAGAVAGPMNVLIVGGYFVGLGVLNNPDTTFSRVVSFVPPLAPTTMLPRAATGHVASWEVPVSIALVLICTWLLVRLAGRIYAGAITQSGPRVRLRDAWRSAGASTLHRASSST